MAPLQEINQHRVSQLLTLNLSHLHLLKTAKVKIGSMSIISDIELTQSEFEFAIKEDDSLTRSLADR